MTTSAQAPKKKFQIVVGYDISELGDRVVEEALDMARHRSAAEVHVITVAQRVMDQISLPGENGVSTEEAAREKVRLRVAQIVDENQRRLGPVGLERIAVYVDASTAAAEPGVVINELAAALDADLVVVGTHARTGVNRLVLGSVASQVVRHATTSVYVVQPTDYVRGKKVPAIQPPLAAGEHALKQFEHRRTYHYIDKVSGWTSRVMPAS